MDWDALPNAVLGHPAWGRRPSQRDAREARGHALHGRRPHDVKGARRKGREGGRVDPAGSTESERPAPAQAGASSSRRPKRASIS